MSNKIKCDGCNFEDYNPELFREFQGNVMVPGLGGLIGGNIFDQKEPDKAELSRKKLVNKSKDGSLRIYALTYCLKCCKRILENK